MRDERDPPVICMSVVTAIEGRTIHLETGEGSHHRLDCDDSRLRLLAPGCISACGLALTVFSSLTACDSVSERALTLVGMREFSGLSAPTETLEAQQARNPDTLQRADLLVLSTMYVETGERSSQALRFMAEAGLRSVHHGPHPGLVETAHLVHPKTILQGS